MARNGSCGSGTAIPRRRWPRSRGQATGAAPRSPSCHRKNLHQNRVRLATLEHRLRELAFLNSGVRLVLTDTRGVEEKSSELHYEGGLEAFVRYLDRSKTALIDPPILISGMRDGVSIEVAMQWTDSYHETMLCFTNNIPQRDGGTHLAGFRAALTRQINNYSLESGVAKKEKVQITGDVRAKA